MVLVVGATGQVGSRVVRLLLAGGTPARVMTRAPQRAAELANLGAEVVKGDLRDPASVKRAVTGCESVIDCAHGLAGEGATRDNNPVTVDGKGTKALVDAAQEAGASHLVYISVLGAAPDAPVEFLRIKHAAEEAVRSSGITYTILRPAAFMETWATMIGEPILKGGRATLFGDAANPVSFVSADDVARLAVAALTRPELENRTLDLGGPEAHSMQQVANLFGEASGQAARCMRIPVPVMRVMSSILKPLKPDVSRLMGMGVLMATTEQTCETSQDVLSCIEPRRRLQELVAERAAN